jgi:hypothetical protein
MYALDAFADNPVTAQWHRIADRGELITRSELPRPEQRFFGAIGTVATKPERPYERRWIFQRDFDLVLERIQTLGIKVEHI